MTNKEWKKIVKREEKAAFSISVKEHKNGNRLTEEFFLGYMAGINFSLRVMEGKNITPEFDYEIDYEIKEGESDID